MPQVTQKNITEAEKIYIKLPLWSVQSFQSLWLLTLPRSAANAQKQYEKKAEEGY